jgi:hypothetical protein
MDYLGLLLITWCYQKMKFGGGAWILPFSDHFLTKSGAVPDKLNLFFTISLPFSGVLRTRTSTLRENFTFSLHFLYQNRA